MRLFVSVCVCLCAHVRACQAMDFPQWHVALLFSPELRTGACMCMRYPLRAREEAAGEEQ